MFGIFGKNLTLNLVESLVDNYVRETVTPKKGSVVYCELAFGNAEHSGIFIGNNKIIHLSGDGRVESVSPAEFLNRLGGFNTAISIYVSCDKTAPTGSLHIAKTAKQMIGSTRQYNTIIDNCHQFTSGCITGNFDNSDNFLWMLKHTAKQHIGSTTWRVWKR